MTNASLNDDFLEMSMHDMKIIQMRRHYEINAYTSA